MAVNSKQDLIDYSLRELGFPVLTINVDEDQLSDRIDEALAFFQEYHSDATQKVYLKHKLSATDISQEYIDMAEASGTVITTNGSNNIVGTSTNFPNEFTVGSNIKIGSEYRTVTAISNLEYMTANTAFTANNDMVPIYNTDAPNSIYTISNIFPASSGSTRINMFDVRYQMRLNDLYTFTSTALVNYTILMQHLRQLEMYFVGETPIRFNKHQNRLYLDWTWGETLTEGEYIIVEAYKIIDPQSFTNIYNDRYLKKYSTALIKRQWGTNLMKWQGVQLPGGVSLNGQLIYEQAMAEIKEIEEKIIAEYSFPPAMQIG